MALIQPGGVNSSSDVLESSPLNHSPLSVCVISSTGVKIIASAPLKFNAATRRHHPGCKSYKDDSSSVHQNASPSRGHPLSKEHQPTNLACTCADLIGCRRRHCGCQRGLFPWDNSLKNINCSSLEVKPTVIFAVHFFPSTTLFSSPLG